MSFFIPLTFTLVELQGEKRATLVSWRDLHMTKRLARWQADKSIAQEEQRLALASACPKCVVCRYTDFFLRVHACLISLIISLIACLSQCVWVISRLLQTQQKHECISIQFLHSPGLWSKHQSRWMPTRPGSPEGVDTLNMAVFSSPLSYSWMAVKDCSERWMETFPDQWSLFIRSQFIQHTNVSGAVIQRTRRAIISNMVT